MNILIINGSPRKKGLISQMLHPALTEKDKQKCRKAVYNL